MKKILYPLAALALAGSACSVPQDTSKADLSEPQVVGDIQPEDYSSVAADQIRVFSNVDDHPTIVRICIDGVAFRTISSTHSSLASPAVARVPEWDEVCP